ncbi:OmpA family protein [Psychrobacter faecalis]
MTMLLRSTLVVLISVLTLSACQTSDLSKQTSQTIKIPNITVNLDSDGDGVLDAIDECPETPPNVVVDAKGCPVEVYTGSLEMQLQGYFEPMSSQLSEEYDQAFAIIEENLHEQPDAKVFIFGHVATNEMDKNALATLGFDSLSRNRALSIKNTLVLQHGIDAKRIRTYDCSNKILVKETDYINPSFKALNLNGLEAKQRRATLMASSSVKDLMNLKYDSYIQMYGKYAKHCKPFE